MGWRGRGPAVCARVQRRSWRCAPPAPSEACGAAHPAQAGSARLQAWRGRAVPVREWRRRRRPRLGGALRRSDAVVRGHGGGRGQTARGQGRVALGGLCARVAACGADAHVWRRALLGAGCLPASTASTGRASRRQSRPPPRAACRARQRGLRAPAARGAGGRRSRPSSRIRRRRRWRRRRARTPTAHRAPHAGRPPPAPARLESPSASAAAAWTRGAPCAGRVPPAAPAAARARRERASLAACAV